MNWFHINNTFINLDLVTKILYSPGRISIFVLNEEYSTSMDFEQESGQQACWAALTKQLLGKA